MFDSSTTWLGFGLLVWMWRTMFAGTCYVRNNQRGKLLSLIAFSLARSFCVSFYFNHYCLPLVRISVSVYLCYCFIVTACKWKKYMKNYYFSLSLFLSYLYSISNLPPPTLSHTHTHNLFPRLSLFVYFCFILIKQFFIDGWDAINRIQKQVEQNKNNIFSAFSSLTNKSSLTHETLLGEIYCNEKSIPAELILSTYLVIGRDLSRFSQLNAIKKFFDIHRSSDWLASKTVFQWRYRLSL